MKPKILFVFHSSDIKSGATHSLMDIVDALIETGKYEISAIFPYQEGTASEWLNNKGISTHIYKYGKLMQDLTQPLSKRILKLPLLIARHISVYVQAVSASKKFADDHFDIVYSNTSSIIFGGILGRKLKCKQIWHIREFRTKDHKMTFYLGEKYIKTFINKNSNAVLCVSKSVLDYQADIIDKRKMYVTYNSYSEDFIAPRKTFNLDAPLQILLAGDIKPGKGQLDAVEAIAILQKRYPNQVVLHLAGRESNAQYAEKIRKMIDTEKIEDVVILHGHVSDMQMLRTQMDAGIVSSEYEAFGRTTIEGMLSMMAMIGRNTGGTSEQIEDGVTGLLYNGTIQDLASKIEFLILNRIDMKNMAIAGFKESKELYTTGYSSKITGAAIMSVLNS